MKQCPHCNSEILDDSLYCDRCGQRLMICADCGTFIRGKFCRICGGKNIIDSFEYEQIHGRLTVSLTGNSSQEGGSNASKGGSRMAELHSADNRISLLLDDSDEFIIGRKSPQFAADLAGCAKMSRKHAMIRWSNGYGQWQVTDLDSAHGTRINGKSIPAETPYDIHDGDTISFAGYEFSFTATGGSTSSSSTTSTDSSQASASVRVDSSAQKLFEKGQNYEGKEDYENAYLCYKKAAEQGYAPAMGSLGYVLLEGEGVEQDEEKALKWLRKGSNMNDGYSQYLLGNLYVYGRAGLEEDYDEALKLYRKAIEKGETGPLNQLCRMYCLGLGVEVDDDEAIKWGMKAVKEGDTGVYYFLGLAYEHKKKYMEALSWYKKGAYEMDSGCMLQIGYLYDDDGGLPVNYQEAVRWYRKAVDNDSDEGLYCLAWMYYYGHGVAEDEDKCYELMRQAADMGNENAIEWLNENN